MKRITVICAIVCMLLPATYLYPQQSDKLTIRKIGKSSIDETKNENYKNFRFTIGGGYAYWLGKQLKTGDKQVDNFTSGLRHGYNIDIEAQYFFNEHIGIGFNGNYIKQSNRESDFMDIPNIGSVRDYKEINKTLYMGSSFVVRAENDKWGFYSSIGLGPLFYTNTGEISNRKASLDKTAFALYYSVSGEHRINNSIGVGLKLAVTSGSVKIEGLKDRQSVSNLMISGFLSFRTK